MNFLAKAFMTLVMVAVGVLPAVVLHAESLPPIGSIDLRSAPAPHDAGPGQQDVTHAPEEPGLPLEEPGLPLEEPPAVPAVEAPGWWERTRGWTSEEADADDADDAPVGDCSYWDRSGCTADDGFPQPEPTQPADDPSQPAETGGTEPGAEPGAPETPEDEGGLLGDLLGG